MCGTPSEAAPDATAERSPFGESSMATASRGETPSTSHACRYGSGKGFGRVASSPATTTSKASKSMRSTTDRAIRPMDIVTSAVLMPARRRSASSSRAPGRNGTPSSRSCLITSSVRWSMIS